MRVAPESVPVVSEGIGELLAGLAPREIRCYRCGARTRASTRAHTVSCSGCFRRVEVQDHHIKMTHFGTELGSCGDIIVTRKARTTTQVLVASGSVKIYGEVRGLVLAGTSVEIGPGGLLIGGAVTPDLVLDAEARIEGGPFRVPFDPIGIISTEEASKRLRRGEDLPTLDALRAMRAKLEEQLAAPAL